MHRFVIGELALGNLLRRESVPTALDDLPQATLATDAEVLRLLAVSTGLDIAYPAAH